MSDDEPTPDPEDETETDTEPAEDLQLFVVAYRPENSELDATTVFENLALSKSLALYGSIATTDRDLFEHIASEAQTAYNGKWGIPAERADGVPSEELPEFTEADGDAGE